MRRVILGGCWFTFEWHIHHSIAQGMYVADGIWGQLAKISARASRAVDSSSFCFSKSCLYSSISSALVFFGSEVAAMRLHDSRPLRTVDWNDLRYRGAADIAYVPTLARVTGADPAASSVTGTCSTVELHSRVKYPNCSIKNLSLSLQEQLSIGIMIHKLR